MFPTPKQRYDVYVAWCHLLGATPLSFTGWVWELTKIPEHKPIAWNQSSASL
jgi:hypothetical protein